MKEEKTYLAVMCRAGTLSMLRTETIWIAKDAQDAATKVDMRPNEDVWVYEFIAGDAKVKPDWAKPYTFGVTPSDTVDYVIGGKFNQGHPSSLLTYEQFQSILRGDGRLFTWVGIDYKDYEVRGLEYYEGNNIVSMANKFPSVTEKLFKMAIGEVIEFDSNTIIIRSN